MIDRVTINNTSWQGIPNFYISIGEKLMSTFFKVIRRNIKFKFMTSC